MRSPWSIAIDAALIVLFATVGRASHREALTLGGIATTAWPFLVVGVIVSALCFAFVHARWWVRGSLVWVATVIGGMALRLAVGGTAAVAFVVVATITLGILLVGWRAIAHLVQQRRQGATDR